MTRRPWGTGRGRSEHRPGCGTVAPQKSPSLPLTPRVSVPLISTVTYLAGTKCSQGSRDTGRSKTGCPVPPQPRPCDGQARCSLSVPSDWVCGPPGGRRGGVSTWRAEASSWGARS